MYEKNKEIKEKKNITELETLIKYGGTQEETVDRVWKLIEMLLWERGNEVASCEHKKNMSSGGVDVEGHVFYDCEKCGACMSDEKFGGEDEE